MNKSFLWGVLISAAVAALYLAAAPAQAASTTWNTTTNLNPSTSSPNQPSSNCSSPTQAGSGTTVCLTTPSSITNGTSGIANSGLQYQGLSSSASGDPKVVYGNQFTFTANGNALQVGAFFLNTNSTTDSTNTFQVANLESYSPGLGVTSKTVGSNSELVGNSPGHTMDNQSVYDAILFKFPSGNYDVTSLTLNLFGDGDFNYYIGSASALSSIQGLAGISLSSLTTANGWTNGGAVTTNVSCNSSGSGCVNNGGSNNNTITADINSADVTGQYLLVIAALNSSNNDDIKIASVTGTQLTTKVPEPSTLALFGTAGLMAFRIRRRKRRA